MWANSLYHFTVLSILIKVAYTEELQKSNLLKYADLYLRGLFGVSWISFIALILQTFVYRCNSKTLLHFHNPLATHQQTLTKLQHV